MLSQNKLNGGVLHLIGTKNSHKPDYSAQCFDGIFPVFTRSIEELKEELKDLFRNVNDVRANGNSMQNIIKSSFFERNERNSYSHEKHILSQLHSNSSVRLYIENLAAECIRIVEKSTSKQNDNVDVIIETNSPCAAKQMQILMKIVMKEIQNELNRSEKILLVVNSALSCPSSKFIYGLLRLFVQKVADNFNVSYYLKNSSSVAECNKITNKESTTANIGNNLSTVLIRVQDHKYKELSNRNSCDEDNERTSQEVINCYHCLTEFDKQHYHRNTITKLPNEIEKNSLSGQMHGIQSDRYVKTQGHGLTRGSNGVGSDSEMSTSHSLTWSSLSEQRFKKSLNCRWQTNSALQNLSKTCCYCKKKFYKNLQVPLDTLNCNRQCQNNVGNNLIKHQHCENGRLQYSPDTIERRDEKIDSGDISMTVPCQTCVTCGRNQGQFPKGTDGDGNKELHSLRPSNVINLYAVEPVYSSTPVNLGNDSGKTLLSDSQSELVSEKNKGKKEKLNQKTKSRKSSDDSKKSDRSDKKKKKKENPKNDVRLHETGDYNSKKKASGEFIGQSDLEKKADHVPKMQPNARNQHVESHDHDKNNSTPKKQHCICCSCDTTKPPPVRNTACCCGNSEGHGQNDLTSRPIYQFFTNSAVTVPCTCYKEHDSCRLYKNKGNVIVQPTGSCSDVTYCKNSKTHHSTSDLQSEISSEQTCADSQTSKSHQGYGCSSEQSRRLSQNAETQTKKCESTDKHTKDKNCFCPSKIEDVFQEFDDKYSQVIQEIKQLIRRGCIPINNSSSSQEQLECTVAKPGFYHKENDSSAFSMKSSVRSGQTSNDKSSHVSYPHKCNEPKQGREPAVPSLSTTDLQELKELAKSVRTSCCKCCKCENNGSKGALQVNECTPASHPKVQTPEKSMYDSVGTNGSTKTSKNPPNSNCLNGADPNTQHRVQKLSCSEELPPDIKELISPTMQRDQNNQQNIKNSKKYNDSKGNAHRRGFLDDTPQSSLEDVAEDIDDCSKTPGRVDKGSNQKANVEMSKQQKSQENDNRGVTHVKVDECPIENDSSNYSNAAKSSDNVEPKKMESKRENKDGSTKKAKMPKDAEIKNVNGAKGETPGVKKVKEASKKKECVNKGKSVPPRETQNISIEAMALYESRETLPARIDKPNKQDFKEKRIDKTIIDPHKAKGDVTTKSVIDKKKSAGNYSSDSITSSDCERFCFSEYSSTDPSSSGNDDCDKMPCNFYSDWELDKKTTWRKEDPKQTRIKTIEYNKNMMNSKEHGSLITNLNTIRSKGFDDISSSSGTVEECKALWEKISSQVNSEEDTSVTSNDELVNSSRTELYFMIIESKRPIKWMPGLKDEMMSQIMSHELSNKNAKLVGQNQTINLPIHGGFKKFTLSDLKRNKNIFKALRSSKAIEKSVKLELAPNQIEKNKIATPPSISIDSNVNIKKISDMKDKRNDSPKTKVLEQTDDTQISQFPYCFTLKEGDAQKSLDDSNSESTAGTSSSRHLKNRSKEVQVTKWNVKVQTAGPKKFNRTDISNEVEEKMATYLGLERLDIFNTLSRITHKSLLTFNGR